MAPPSTSIQVPISPSRTFSSINALSVSTTKTKIRLPIEEAVKADFPPGCKVLCFDQEGFRVGVVKDVMVSISLPSQNTFGTYYEIEMRPSNGVFRTGSGSGNDNARMKDSRILGIFGAEDLRLTPDCPVDVSSEYFGEVFQFPGGGNGKVRGTILGSFETPPVTCHRCSASAGVGSSNGLTRNGVPSRKFFYSVRVKFHGMEEVVEAHGVPPEYISVVSPLRRRQNVSDSSTILSEDQFDPITVPVGLNGSPSSLLTGAEEAKEKMNTDPIAMRRSPSLRKKPQPEDLPIVDNAPFKSNAMDGIFQESFNDSFYIMYHHESSTKAFSNAISNGEREIYDSTSSFEDLNKKNKVIHNRDGENRGDKDTNSERIKQQNASEGSQREIRQAAPDSSKSSGRGRSDSRIRSKSQSQSQTIHRRRSKSRTRVYDAQKSTRSSRSNALPPSSGGSLSSRRTGLKVSLSTSSAEEDEGYSIAESEEELYAQQRQYEQKGRKEERKKHQDRKQRTPTSSGGSVRNNVADSDDGSDGQSPSLASRRSREVAQYLNNCDVDLSDESPKSQQQKQEKEHGSFDDISEGSSHKDDDGSRYSEDVSISRGSERESPPPEHLSKRESTPSKHRSKKERSASHRSSKREASKSHRHSKKDAPVPSTPVESKKRGSSRKFGSTWSPKVTSSGDPIGGHEMHEGGEENAHSSQPDEEMEHDEQAPHSVGSPPQRRGSKMQLAVPSTRSQALERGRPVEGCYLLFDATSGGKLTIKYSKTMVEGAIGFWAPGKGKKLQGFKFKQNQGRSDLMKGLAGKDYKKKYFNGWCQFVKAAKMQQGSICKWSKHERIELDIYVFYNDSCEVKKIEDGELFDVSDIDAVTCLPKGNSTFDGVKTGEYGTFINRGDAAGASMAVR